MNKWLVSFLLAFPLFSLCGLDDWEDGEEVKQYVKEKFTSYGLRKSKVDSMTIDSGSDFGTKVNKLCIPYYINISDMHNGKYDCELAHEAGHLHYNHALKGAFVIGGLVYWVSQNIRRAPISYGAWILFRKYQE